MGAPTDFSTSFVHHFTKSRKLRKSKNLEHSDPSEVEVMRDKIRKLEATLETTVKAKDEKEKELMSKIEELQMFKYDQVETQANEVLDILFVFMENNGFKGIAF